MKTSIVNDANRFNNILFVLLSVVFLVINNNNLSAQSKLKFDYIIRSEVVEKTASMITDLYVFPKIGDKMGKMLLDNLKNGKNNEITNPKEFAAKLSVDLKEICNDEHLELRFDPVFTAKRNNYKEPTKEEREKNRKRNLENLQKRNFGFAKVDILAGNIGYLDLRSFSRIDYSGATAIAAMNFLAYTDAIIIDIRNNNGGEPEMVQLLCSYLIHNKELSSIYWGPTKTTKEFWTLPLVQGKRNLDAELYILTSGRTFSAAEAFAYDLKQLGRATIVGETTRGGAHLTGGSRLINNNFVMKVSVGRAINPITNSNWEKVGVKPNIVVPAKKAYEKAVKIAFDKFFKHADQNELNSAGYAALNSDINEAIRIFKMNVERHPDYANGYDSLGEAYMRNNEIELAIKNYKNSLELNPNNTNAIEMLKKIENN